MSTWEFAKNCIPWLISIISLAFVVFRYSRDLKKDTREDINNQNEQFSKIREKNLELGAGLQQVIKTSTDTLVEVRGLNTAINKIEGRVGILETRVEYLEKEGNKT